MTCPITLPWYPAQVFLSWLPVLEYPVLVFRPSKPVLVSCPVIMSWIPVLVICPSIFSCYIVLNTCPVDSAAALSAWRTINSLRSFSAKASSEILCRSSFPFAPYTSGYFIIKTYSEVGRRGEEGGRDIFFEQWSLKNLMSYLIHEFTSLNTNLFPCKHLKLKECVLSSKNYSYKLQNHNFFLNTNKCTRVSSKQADVRNLVSYLDPFSF